MSIKDYYKVLQIPVGADHATIKKAFRRLALAYHPDKQGESAESNSHYREIQEAYETLSDPVKKETYLFKRWLNQAHAIQNENATSAEELIVLLVKTESFLSGVDAYRIDSLVLVDYLKKLLNSDQLMLIKQRSDNNMEAETINLSLRICHLLDSAATTRIESQLKSVFQFNQGQAKAWEDEIKRKIKKENWEKLKIPLVLILTLAICLLIFGITR